MSLNDLGAVPASTTIYLFWTSHDGATGANEAASNLAVGDILIYKNGSVTQRSSTSGFTLLDTDGIDFDSLTGVNGVSIDLSDNTDAGFYAVGSWYTVILGPITIDTQTVYLNLASFRIVAAEGITGKPKVDVDGFGGSAGTFASGRPEVNTTHAAGTAWGSGAITAASIATGAIDADAIADNAIDAGAIANGAIDAATFAAGAIDAAALAADAGTEIATAVWASGTRTLSALDEDSTTLDLDATIRSAVGLAAANLDTQLDALPTAAENADAVWDEDATAHQTGGTFGQAIGDPGANTETMYKAIVTDPAGTNIAADIIAVKAETASILEDTGTTLDGKLDTIDNFLDTEITAIKDKTDQLTFTVANQVDANALTLDEDEILDDSLADSVPADGALPTVRQALYMLVQFMTERSVSGTTLTVKKVDGSTSLMTFTLDDADAPTSITRAS